jgi:hypothetical protein
MSSRNKLCSRINVVNMKNQNQLAGKINDKIMLCKFKIKKCKTKKDIQLKVGILRV